MIEGLIEFLISFVIGAILMGILMLICEECFGKPSCSKFDSKSFNSGYSQTRHNPDGGSLDD